MQKLFDEGANKRGLLTSGLSMVGNNKRFIVWFWLLNLTLAEFGVAAFRRHAHPILDHSLYASGLVHGFDLGVLADMLSRPEFGPLLSSAVPAFYFSLIFFLAAALFLPGVFAGYGSAYRLPREDFFRVCGKNLWRFIRLMIVAGIVMAIFAGILFGINAAIAKKASESTYEMLPFELNMTGLAVIFLVMTTLRIWFDLAEADVVLSDQRAVRKSIAAAFGHTFRNLSRLLTSYVIAALFAAAILVGGVWVWMKFVPSESVIKASVVAQIILFLLLIPRFWQRGVAVSYWQQRMLAPVGATEPLAPPSIVPQMITPQTIAPASEPPSASPDAPPTATETSPDSDPKPPGSGTPL
jgi:hypothetical protein